MRLSYLWAVIIAVVVGWTSSAAMAQSSDFQRWVRDFRATAVSAGVSGALYDRVFAGMEPDPRIKVSAENQPEFVRPIWHYLDSAVSADRISHGQTMVDEWSGWLDRIEKTYGVNRHVVLAIWGMESSYGRVLDNPNIMRSTPRALATLAFKDRKRARFARRQLIAALKILQNGDVSLEQMQGSWAGAMGHTQFIPTTYEAYAVDITGDGKRDIWNSVPDALASTAAYLSKVGWRPGETWGYEVVLPKGFDYSLSNQSQEKSLRSWSRLRIKRVNGLAFPRPSDRARLYTPAGAKGPAFLLLKNFSVIKRYNNSNAYALAVGHLSDRLLGFDDFDASWPRNDRPLTSTQKVELQTQLQRLGYKPGKADGKVGNRTRRAIQAFQRDIRQVPDGYASLELLKRLQARP